MDEKAQMIVTAAINLLRMEAEAHEGYRAAQLFHAANEVDYALRCLEPDFVVETDSRQP